MRVAVLGDAGQLATCLGESCPERIELRFFGPAEMDLLDPAFELTTLEAFDPDWVINAAAYTAVDKAEEEKEAAFQLNCHAPERVAKFCARREIPFVHISTDYVFDGEGERTYAETDETGPCNVYALSKLKGDEAVAAAQPKYLILRVSWLYSAFGNNFVKTMIKLSAMRDELTIVHDQRGAPTSAHDLAAALWQVVQDITAREEEGERVPWGLYHYSGAGSASWAEFAERIFHEAGDLIAQKPRVVRIPTSDYPTAARRPHHTVLDCSKFDRTFGVARPHWHESLQSVIAKLKEESSL